MAAELDKKQSNTQTEFFFVYQDKSNIYKFPARLFKLS